MSTPALLLCDPGELLRAGQALGRIGAELEELATRLLRGGDVPGWSGMAALAQRARAQAVADLVRSCVRPVEEMAGAVHRCAQVAQTAGEQATRWRRSADDAAEEIFRLRQLGPPPEPLLAEAWRRRVEELEVLRARARRWVAEAEEDFEAAQRAAAEVVARAWSVVQDLRQVSDAARQLRRGIGSAIGTGERIWRGTQAVVEATRARWARGAQARAAAAARSRQALARLRELGRVGPGTPTVRGLRLVPGPLGLTLTWFGAFGDVRDGAGYDGWRGATTKVLAAGAIAGGPLALGGVLHPVVGAVGVGLVAAHQTWMTGNAIWDGASTASRYVRRFAGPHLARGRERLAHATARAGLRVQARLEQVRREARRMATVGRPLVRRGVDTVRGQAVHVADATLDRLRDIPPLRDWWRQVGGPIRLPDTPPGPDLEPGRSVDLRRAWGLAA